MKFNINSKDFKELAEKAITCVNKKAAVEDLTRIYLNVTEYGKLEIRTSNLEHYLILEYDNIFNFEPGFCTIDNEDLKVVNKLSGILKVTKEENKLIFDNGNKKLTIPCYNTYEITFPKLEEKKTTTVMETTEAWMLETLTKLDTFTTHMQEKKNIAMECFNFNTAKNRIEALDGHRIGIRLLNQCTIGEEKQEIKYMLLNKCIPVFKKVLDKKSECRITYRTDGNYNKISGNNFTFYSKCINALYFNTSNLLSIETKNNCNIDRKNLLEIAKYNKDLRSVKEYDKHMVLKYLNNNLYSYMKTSRYETLDTVETKEINIQEGFTIAFNPQFLYDGLNIMEEENVKMEFNTSIHPVLMTCEEYKYLLLPVHFKTVPGINTLEERINQLTA